VPLARDNAMIGSTSRKIVVIGATGGIGSAVALQFLQSGDMVFLHGRDESKFAQLTAQLGEKYPEMVSGATADITDESGRQNIRDAVYEWSPNIDSLVLCVGNGNVDRSPFLSVSQWDAILQQNFLGNAGIIAELVPLLEKSKDSNITCIGSIAGLMRLPAPVGYAVAKAALNAYTKALVPHLSEKGIRINIVHPGNVFFLGGRWDELEKGDPDGVAKYIQTEVPQKRFGAPEDIASAVFFLASGNAKFITGASFVVDGGQLKTL
jgi:3-oxoacyl-[acyl-carrier protein] reductase